MEHSVKLYSLDLTQKIAAFFALLFVAGNVALPKLCHLIPQGGAIFLPIYFFTLIGAYKYGWQVGLLTAVASPSVNNILFGMPPVGILPVILVKSVLLSVSAAFVARKSRRVTLAALILVVVSYQVVGSLAEWAVKGDFGAALRNLRLGVPGLLIQIAGGYLVMRYPLRK